MRPVLLALALACSFAATASAAVPAGVPLGCFSSTGGTFALEGYLQLEAGPAGYRFNTDFPEDELAGSWNSDATGTVAFADGPLAGATLMVAPAGTTMPGDQVEGRRWPFLLEGADEVRWYCRSLRVHPRRAFAFDESWVEKRTGLPVKLPRSLEIQSLYFSLEDVPYSSTSTRVRVATKRLWRLELLGGPCAASDDDACPTYAIFSAKRAPRAALEVRFNKKLARGARGWVGSVGCAFGSGVGWGPVYCGQTIIVWHHKGVNYCIESRTAGDAGLVRMANQALRDSS